MSNGNTGGVMRKIVIEVPDDDCRNCRLAITWGINWKRLKCPFRRLDINYETAKPEKACRDAEIQEVGE